MATQADQIKQTWNDLAHAELAAVEAGDQDRVRLFSAAQRFGAGSSEWRDAVDILTRLKAVELPCGCLWPAEDIDGDSCPNCDEA